MALMPSYERDALKRAFYALFDTPVTLSRPPISTAGGGTSVYGSPAGTPTVLSTFNVRVGPATKSQLQVLGDQVSVLIALNIEFDEAIDIDERDHITFADGQVFIVHSVDDRQSSTFSLSYSALITRKR